MSGFSQYRNPTKVKDPAENLTTTNLVDLIREEPYKVSVGNNIPSIVNSDINSAFSDANAIINAANLPTSPNWAGDTMKGITPPSTTEAIKQETQALGLTFDPKTNKMTLPTNPSAEQLTAYTKWNDSQATPWGDYLNLATQGLGALTGVMSYFDGRKNNKLAREAMRTNILHSNQQAAHTAQFHKDVRSAFGTA